MRANSKMLVKLAELGILRSMPDFLGEPLKPGRLKGRFVEVEFIVDYELKQLYEADPDIFIDNRQEIAAYLEKFSKIMNTEVIKKKDIHIASVVCFCLNFLEDTKTVYPKKLYEYLQDILEYYERVDNVQYSDFMKGRNFYEEWEKVNNV